MLTGFQDVQHRMQALAYWVISDHFEELGRGPTLFHNGFGLLTVGNLRKPRYWAAHLAAHQGDAVLARTLSGDGAEVLVRAWPTRHDDGTVDVLVWNGTNNGELMDGDPRLDRAVHVVVDGLPTGGHRVSLARVDAHHSNILDGYPADTPWPDDELWRSLRERDRLDEHELRPLTAGETRASLEVTVPMPGIARIRFTPMTEEGLR